MPVGSVGRDTNIQGLINEVLGMVQKSQDPDSEISKRKREEEEKLAQRGHSFEMEKQKLLNTGGLDIQKTRNVGETDVQGLRNTGEVARQALANVGTSDVANIHARGATDVANIGAKSALDVEGLKSEASKYHSDKFVEAYQGRTGDPDKLIEEMTKNMMFKTPEDALEFRRKLRLQNKSVPPTMDSVRKFDKPAQPSSILTPSVNPKPGGSSLLTPTRSAGEPLKTRMETRFPDTLSLPEPNRMTLGEQNLTSPNVVERQPLVRKGAFTGSLTKSEDMPISNY